MSTLYQLLLSIVIVTSTTDNNNYDHMTITQISENKKDNQLTIRIFTELQNNYYKLINPEIVATPNINGNNMQFKIGYDADDEDGDECINNPLLSQCCYQTFIISSTNNKNKHCPLRLEGIFSIEFDTQCNTQCTDINIDDVKTDKILLQTHISYKDEICDEHIFNVNELKRKMRYFQDNNYEKEMDKTDLYSPNDECFVEIDLFYPSSIYDTFNNKIILQNVWLCTTPPNDDDDIFNFEKQGCFEDSIDQNGPYWIIRNHGDGPYLLNAKIIMETGNIIRFSFKIPKDIYRDTLYIHTQLIMEIINDENMNKQSIYFTIIGHTKIKGIKIPYYDNYDNYDHFQFGQKKFIFAGKGWMFSLELMTAILILLSCILLISMKIFNNDNDDEMDELSDNQQDIGYNGNQKKRKRKKIKMRKKHYLLKKNNDDDDEDDDIDVDDDDDFEDLEHDDNDPLDDSY